MEILTITFESYEEISALCNALFSVLNDDIINEELSLEDVESLKELYTKLDAVLNSEDYTTRYDDYDRDEVNNF